MEKKKKERNEKSFNWHDIKLYTLFGLIYPNEPPASLHAHSQYEMFVFKEANGYLKTDDRKIRLSRNNLIIIPPDTNHAVVYDNPLTVKGITIRFYYKKINDRRQQNNGQMFTYFNSFMPTQNNIIILKNKTFGIFFSEFIEENESVPILASSLIIHMLQGLFLNILRSLSNKNFSGEPTSIYSYTTAALSNDVIVANMIETFMSRADCTLQTLADHLNMSPRNIQRILKKTYGKSYTEKVAEVRLTIATDLMSNPDYSLREIAEKSNYNNYDSFRKAFLLKHGISPSEYRELLLNKKI